MRGIVNIVAGWRLLAAAAALLMLGGASGAEPVAPGVGITNPTLALGLTGIADYSSERPFLDLMHTARPWFGSARNIFETLPAAKLMSIGSFDEHGWPKTVPTDAGTQVVRTYWESQAIEHGQKYVLTYRGQGQLRLDAPRGRVNIFSAAIGRILFSVSGDDAALTLAIISTDPGHTGDYIRDISIVPEKYEDLAKLGEIFNPDWLAIVNDARELRFMDWMNTNNSQVTDWSDRAQAGDYNWRIKGVPLEVMVQLANQTGAEPWFTMPAQVSDDYVTQFATYVRDHLNPDLQVHVEWSNEPWNFGFGQARWAQQQAQALWGGDASNLDYQAMRATQVGMIWDRVFGADAKKRVDNVLGLQNGNAWWLQNRMLTGVIWKNNDPDHFVEPTSVIDSVAVTTYFGLSTLSNDAFRQQLVDAMHSMTFDEASRWLAGKLLDPSYDSSIPRIAGNWAMIKAVTDAFGVKLVAYEGGQHVLHASWGGVGLTDKQIDEINDWVTRFIRSPAMADLYQVLWNDWSAVSDGPFMQFTDVSTAGKYGAWGLYDHIGDTSPRIDLLNELNAAGHSWFGDGGGSRYQQGVIKMADAIGESLIGTGKQDFLVGGDGADTFIPGPGNDAIDGGGGRDTVVLAGSRDDYKVSTQDQGYLLTGADGTKRLLNVENIAFDDGKAAAQPLAALVH